VLTTVSLIAGDVKVCGESTSSFAEVNAEARITHGNDRWLILICAWMATRWRGELLSTGGRQVHEDNESYREIV
jgi:hypothetical protein